MIRDFHSSRFSLFVVSLVLLLLSDRVVAQTPGRFASQGVWEFGGNVAYQRTTMLVEVQADQTSSIFSFLPYVGYFPFNNGIEFGLNPLGVQRYWDSENRTTVYTILGTVGLTGNAGGIFFPFAEVQLGYSAEILGGAIADLNPGQKQRDGFAWGVRGGVKCAVIDHCLVNAGLQYQEFTLETKSTPIRTGSNVLMASIGLTFWF